jgi:hypothetical protein
MTTEIHLCPRCHEPIPTAWYIKGCGRWRIYARGTRSRRHHPEPPYTLSAIHCPACWFMRLHGKKKK